MQFLSICLVIGLFFVVTGTWAEDEQPQPKEYVPPLQLRSCIPLYCRKSCKQQSYYEGYCSEEKLCTCRREMKIPPSKVAIES